MQNQENQTEETQEQQAPMGEITPEALEIALRRKPELRDEIFEAVREEQEYISGIASSILSGAPAKKRRGRGAARADTSGNVMKHGEAILALLKTHKKGLRSGEIRKLAKTELNHNFGSSMHTTLNNLTTGDPPLVQWEGEKRNYVYKLAK